jgi:hypothetical protein
MPLAPGALGVIHMERKPSRVESFLEREEQLDCAGELIRLSRGQRSEDSLFDGADDEIVFADTERLSRELNMEYATLCETVAALRR